MEEETLDFWLAQISVAIVDDYHNEVNDGKLSGILGWYMVIDESGVNAYFSTPSAALHHRLTIINNRLNNV